jgi:HAE1 family hydrophobic/amphiphilic exporter-1
MSWLTKISLRNGSIVGLAVLAVILVGGFAVTSLKQELMPDLAFPYLTVLTVDQAASAADIERSITTPLEQVIKTSSGVKVFNSFSNDSLSIITIEYEFGTDMKAKEAEVQSALAGVQQMLPATALAPKVAALNINSMPVVQLAVSSPLPAQQLAGVLGTRVVPRLQAIEGVQAVTLSGVQQMQLNIQLKPERVAALGITPMQIMTAVTEANVTAGAGSVTSGSIVYPITVSAKAETARALEDLVLPSAQAAAAATATGSAAAVTTPPVRLGDVATVKIAPAPLTAITRTNGQPTIGISVSKASSGNTVDIANAVADEVAAITSDLDGQVKITTVLDQSIFIKESINSLLREGVLGALFAIVVIWVFLFSWRSTLIAGLSIPLSIIGALIILWSRGQSLNMLTLGGLTIAIGRVIDDSIVVIENTYRHLQEGESIRRAAYTGTKEVAGAITASTLTTVAVFLPLGFVHGLASEFFRPFALTVTFALLCSLAVALIVVPVVSTWVLSKKQAGHRDSKELSRLQNAYVPTLNFALDHKVVTLVAAAAIFAATMALTPMLKTNLFDSSGQNTMSITQTLPPGTSLGATMAVATKVEAVLKATEGVQTYQVTGGSTGSLFGSGGGTSASSSQAAFSITTDPNADKNAIVEDIRTQVALLKNAGSIAVTGEDSSAMGGASLMEVQVSAGDPAVLKQANDLVLAKMKQVDGLTDVTSNLSEGRPSATIIVDQAKAAAAGVTPTTLGQYTTLVLNGYPLGMVPTEAGTLPAQLMVAKITVPPLPGAVAQVLAQLPVAGTSGMVPLGDIAKVVEIKAPVQITHVDGARTASVTATPVGNNIGAASADVEAALATVELPAGATWELAGATQMTNDVFRSLGIAMLVAILLVYLIMVATFRSLLNPLILLVSIPFAAVGAVLALLITETSLGMPSMVGLLMLIGIVVTNAIVLLDLVEQFRRRGMDARTAVVEGGRRRLRPILMTAVATILALVPMAVGVGGTGGFLSTPLAIIVIGGLLSSTFLTLIIVPVLYVSVARWRRPAEDDRFDDEASAAQVAEPPLTAA